MKVVYKKEGMLDKLHEFIMLAMEDGREIDYVSITKTEASKLLDELRMSDAKYLTKQVIDIHECNFFGVWLKVEGE